MRAAVSTHAQRGFTLIEMIVALAILSVALGVLLGAFSQDMDHQRLTRAQMHARMLAQSLLEQSNLRDQVQPGTRHGVTQDGAIWAVTVAPYGTDEDRKAWPGLPVQVTATVDWSLDGHAHRVSLTTLRMAPQSGGS
jgi:general secretion pathway protein I